MTFKLIFSVALAFAFIVGASSSTMAQQETTVYATGTYNMGSGKVTGTAGASTTQTRGGTTTKVDVNVNTKGQVNGTASQTKTSR